MINANDLHALAVFMVENHGPKALNLADRAVWELETMNETSSADAWRALRSVVEDMLAGRLSQSEAPRVH